jgi:uncharacterized phiE125 gp8 family phage protein
VKAYLRVDGTDDDSVIEALMLAAREEVETFCGLTLLTTTYALRLDAFPCNGVIRLPRPPLQSVTSIVYLDDAGVSQTLATSNYVVNTYSMPGQILMTSSGTWPGTYDQYNAVTITYTAGFTLATIPERAKMAMKLMIGDYYEHREAQLETRIYCNETVKRLLWGLRLLEAA